MEEQVKREFVADTQREVDKIDGEVEAKLITLETKPQSRILGRFPDNFLLYCYTSYYYFDVTIQSTNLFFSQAAASVQGAYIGTVALCAKFPC